MAERLESLTEGMAIPFGGDRLVRVPADLARAFGAGDHLVVVQETGDLLHIPAEEWETARHAVDRAVTGFAKLGSVPDADLDHFYAEFARLLSDDDDFSPIAAANTADVEKARAKGRSTTRLELTETMRSDMIAAIGIWQKTEGATDPVDIVRHEGWRVELRKAGLGVVGFVFEGRPNVFADATGVLRSGNSAVMRIGSDALGTARAIMEHALSPALRSAGLPEGAVSLVDSVERSAGWAMFSDPRLGLAVARGSGSAVGQLGAVASQTGTPVSLHGTGGAWMVVASDADPSIVESVVFNSLDRKVCNTLNTAVVVDDVTGDLTAAVMGGLRRAADRLGTEPVVHTGTDALGVEWEWEESPEISLVSLETLDQAIESFNLHSPRFVASLISPDPEAHDHFYARIEAPFVGDGFTRWVDGQYALDLPELGLSNWQHGRLMSRGGVLSGNGIYTVRTRTFQDDMTLGR